MPARQRKSSTANCSPRNLEVIHEYRRQYSNKKTLISDCGNTRVSLSKDQYEFGKYHEVIDNKKHSVPFVSKADCGVKIKPPKTEIPPNLQLEKDLDYVPDNLINPVNQFSSEVRDSPQNGPLFNCVESNIENKRQSQIAAYDNKIDQSHEWDVSCIGHVRESELSNIFGFDSMR